MQPGLKEVLESLRKEDKFVFLTTNYDTNTTNTLMTASFGEEWMSHFDLILLDCHRPLFFRCEHTFCEFDEKDRNCYGKRISTGQ